jgi:hypothetical protein
MIQHSEDAKAIWDDEEEDEVDRDMFQRPRAAQRRIVPPKIVVTRRQDRMIPNGPHQYGRARRLARSAFSAFLKLIVSM